MKRVMYGTQTLVLEDRSAEELLGQALAIAESQDPELVRVDVVQADGSTREAALLIGPATPVLAIDAPDLSPERRQRPVAAMARVRSIDRTVVYDDSHTYFDLGFDA